MVELSKKEYQRSGSKFDPEIIFFVLALVLVCFSRAHNFLLFHNLAELFSIVVSFGVFMIAWNARRFMDNNYLLFLGIAYLFVGSLDVVHTLAYKGMMVFPGSGGNLSTQLWIVTRYLQSFSLLIAPFFLGRKLKISFVMFGYFLVTYLGLFSIFYWKIFPVCFIEGVGLTPFKVISEYIISIILFTSIALLYQKRERFDLNVFKLLVASIAMLVASELSFTLYTDVFGFFNMLGHVFKIVAFYLAYRVIIKMGLEKPYSLLFRELKQNEEALRKARSELEVRVEQRTSELMVANEQLQKLKSGLELKVAERTHELKEKLAELERFQEATLDRELRMKELRDKIERLENNGRNK